ncbi:vacuolar fusion protein CCZ1 [Acrasis kona]|uniref:Vacuolar fusion protein CCZ1 n=1 Tax=Acrasis kona TaxID=1008807 RepID=A0AAW2YZV5_9EUKA
MSTGIVFHRFFIFNSKFQGKREEDDYLKMLTFFPRELELNEKMRSIGLAEAIAMFTNTFTTNEKEQCETILCDNKRYVLLQVEPGYWVVMSVNLLRQADTTKNVTPDQSKIPRIKDFSLYEDYDLPYKILQSVLSTAYQTFRVFKGKMEDIYQKNGVDHLKNTLDLFYSRYLSTLSFFSKPVLPANISSSMNVFNVLDGIHFLPVDPSLFLHVQSFINTTCNTFNKPSTNLSPSPEVPRNAIHAAMFMFDHYLLFSGGINHEEVRTISNYMPSLLEDRFRELNGGQSSRRSVRADGLLTGPENIKNNETRFSAPKVILGEKQTECHIIVYKHQRITVLFFVDNSIFTKISFYHRLTDEILTDLHRLNTIISEGMNYIPSFDDTYKYIYFNHMNLAIKTSLAKKQSILLDDQHSDDSENMILNSSGASVKETLNIIAHAHNEFRKSKDGLKETYMRTKRDGWVVGKYFGGKEFYIILDQKNFSLMEVQEQVHKISNIFFSSSNNKE